PLKPVVITTDKAEEPTKPSTAVESVTMKPLTAESSPAASLRPTAVSAASDLPFIPAQPLPTSSSVRPAITQVNPAAKSAVAQAKQLGSGDYREFASREGAVAVTAASGTANSAGNSQSACLSGQL